MVENQRCVSRKGDNCENVISKTYHKGTLYTEMVFDAIGGASHGIS